MAVSITRDTSDNANVIIGRETIGTSAIAISIAVDYVSVYGRIASALENLSANVNILNSNLANTNSLLTNISTTLTSIDGSWKNIDGYIDNINERGDNKNKGFYVQQIENEQDGRLNNRQQRAITISALKKSGSLDDIKEEIRNPTSLPTG